MIMKAYHRAVMDIARKKFTNIVTIGAPGTVSELLKHYHYC